MTESFFNEKLKAMFWKSLVMIVNAVIIGLAVALANLILLPILSFTGGNTLIAIIILFVILIIFGFLLVPLNKKQQKYESEN